MPTDPFHLSLLASLILLAAVLYSSVGHAGASGYIAAMVLFGVATPMIKPTALVLNILVACVGTWRFASAGQVPWKLLGSLCIGSIPAAFLGGWIALPPRIYEPMLAACLVLAALRLIFAEGDTAPRAHPPLWGFIALGALLGFVSGLTGIGGGIFLSPILILTGWENPRRTAATSAPFILVNSISGLLGHASSMQHIPAQAALLAIVALCGGLFGSWLAVKKLRFPALRRILALVMLVAASKLVAELFRVE
ncbi:MAG TPA: sulfite exporter TauE/SafE family protein [bacterium]|nr:sulfite exporter TauE/SafE family protein [bacterium]